MLTSGSTVTASPPLRGYKPARLPGVKNTNVSAPCRRCRSITSYGYSRSSEAMPVDRGRSFCRRNTSYFSGLGASGYHLPASRKAIICPIQARKNPAEGKRICR